jgi:DNA (cytosine-5)-methyltransferase 1
VNKYRFIDLFAGIGGIRLPFDEAGCECVFSSEIDKGACETYYANFGHVPYGDITKIEACDIPDHDILLAGFPCQAFSIIGKRGGFGDTRGTLFFEIARILAEKQPRAFLLENVKQLCSHDGGKTFQTILRILDELGYHVHWRVLNALDYGLPQKRERVMIVGFRDNLRFEFPDPVAKYTPLSELLFPDCDVDRSYFASDRITSKRRASVENAPCPSIWHENKGGHVSALPYSCALRAGASHNYLLVNGIRRLTPREMLRLQGFPDSYNIVVSDGALKKQAGNSVPVSMIRAVSGKIIESMDRGEVVPTYVQVKIDNAGEVGYDGM